MDPPFRALKTLTISGTLVNLVGPHSGAECATLIGPVQPADRNYRYRYTNCSLDPLVTTLSADRPILNKTGLTGLYDITIFATPEFRMRDTSEPGDVRFLDAVRALGLRQDAPKLPNRD